MSRSQLDQTIADNLADNSIGGITPEDVRGVATALANYSETTGGVSLPSGGTTGQSLVKLSNQDGDAGWDDVSGGASIAGTVFVSPTGRAEFTPVAPSSWARRSSIDPATSAAFDAVIDSVNSVLSLRGTGSGPQGSSQLRYADPNSITPGADFDRVYKYKLHTNNDSFQFAGFFIENENAGSAIVAFGIFWNGSWLFQRWVDMAFTNEGAMASGAVVRDTYVDSYVRIKRDGPVVNVYTSGDGVNWSWIGDWPLSDNMSGDVTHIGALINAIGINDGQISLMLDVQGSDDGPQSVAVPENEIAVTGRPRDEVSGAYSLVAGDVGRLKEAVAASVVTIPAGVFGDGVEIDVAAYTSDAVQITAASGVTLNRVAGGSVTLSGDLSRAKLRCRGADAFVVEGDVGAVS